MKARYTLVLVVALVVVVCVTSMAQKTSDELVPTTEFMSAAMKNQLSGPGAFVEVSYKYTVASDCITYHYVRSADIKRLDSEQDGSDVPKEHYSYDNVTGEYRQLTLRSIGQSSGRIGGMRGGGINSQVVFDPISRPLDGDLLYKSILRGIIEGKETIDGHSCWRVVVNSVDNKLTTEKCVVWLDPSIGFCPRQILIDFKDSYSTQDVTIMLLDYREVADSIWFPSEIDYIGNPVERTPAKGVAKMKSINVQPVVARDKLIVSFPSGTEVRDDLIDAEYTAP